MMNIMVFGALECLWIAQLTSKELVLVSWTIAREQNIVKVWVADMQFPWCYSYDWAFASSN